ncbi:MAG: monofunctional biosynthetic peptidoglycan transglycosylase [Minwuia sp.]|uniref:monofunctional biosynthetic peptidoglycan transglycosylase n=1 Tax=Minwuia sp. TaxID=2493630 RepID=UPI003A846704
MLPTWLRRLAFTLVALLLLPVVLSAVYAVVPPPGTPLMVIRWIEGDGLTRDWVSIDEVPDHVPLSVLAAEDNRFCEHGGFDWDAIGDAIDDAQAGKGLRGASTVSMQLTRNLFLWPGGGFARKGLEAVWTPAVELFLGKRRIMEIYLNVAETGIGTFGFEAAAQRYYGKGAAALSRREAAAIAAILPNPRGWSPGQGYAGNRVPVLLRRMGDIAPIAGCVTEDG